MLAEWEKERKEGVRRWGRESDFNRNVSSLTALAVKSLLCLSPCMWILHLHPLCFLEKFYGNPAYLTLFNIWKSARVFTKQEKKQKWESYKYISRQACVTGVFISSLMWHCVWGLFTDLPAQSLDTYGYSSLTSDSISTWQNSLAAAAAAHVYQIDGTPRRNWLG